MSPDKLTQIIQDKNERLEREAVSEAADIIDQIADRQEKIVAHERVIIDLRKRLADLQVTQINPTSILG